MTVTIFLGDEVKDLVSGFTGIAMTRHEYLNGCNRFTVQPKMDESHELPKAETFDEPQLELVAEGANRLGQGPASRVKVGDKVRDIISNYEGVVESRHVHLFGSDRFNVQAQVDEAGKLPEYQTFDGPQLEVIEAGAVNLPIAKPLTGIVGIDQPGGPEKSMPRQRRGE